MSITLETKLKNTTDNGKLGKLAEYLPSALPRINNPQTEIPNIKKKKNFFPLFNEFVQCIPKNHDLYVGDARPLPFLAPDSVHLILTTPPYWTLKEYRDSKGQLGHV